MKFIDTSQFSSLELKVFNTLLHHAYPDLLKLSEFEILTLELYKKSMLTESAFNEDDYDKLVESLSALASTYVQINYINENTNEEEYTISPIVSSFQFKDDRCIYSFNNFIKSLLCKSDICSNQNER